MFHKILIANRGEIACRIAHVCRQLDVATVGVYSEADAQARHVGLVDEAVEIGPPRVHESYLRGDHIIKVAVEADAEAIHPGYGLLAENADFARACRAAGLTFIGPHADVIALMGDKARAREFAREAGVPVVPGSDGSVPDEDAAIELAAELGYPVMVKAVWGGGGIGMVRADSERRLVKALKRAQSRAQAAFGNPETYLEKAIEQARHIEVQVLFDEHGHGVHLYERECSIQRRHQKVVEEAPSPLLAERQGLRQRMVEAALALCRAAGYTNAGTVEFLVDETAERFYFIEMNTRLQVEHPVTECVTGVPLIERQLWIAAGEPLELEQSDLDLMGAAVECRLYAEDPDRRFLPQPGTISRLAWPDSPGLRIDAGVREGDIVSPYYDPLLAKMVTLGCDRRIAIERMAEALDRLELEGIVTNRGLLARLMRDPRFNEGRLTTSFLEQGIAGAH